MSAVVEVAAATGVRRLFHDHRELREVSSCRGPLDEGSIEDILARLAALPVWPKRRQDQLQCLRGARVVLEWLATHPGTGWQDRWGSAGCDAGIGWVEALTAADRRACALQETRAGLSMLLLARLVAPSYVFLADYQPYNLYLHVQQVHRPEVFTRMRQAGPGLGLHERQLESGLRLLARIVLHTGREVDQLGAEDIFVYRAWSIQHGARSRSGIHLSWTLLREVVDLGEHVSLRAALRFGQRPTAELVDRYAISCAAIRRVLIHYLDERRPGLDHGSFRSLVTVLVGNFWADIERHHPGIDTLHLPEEIAQAWKLRMATVSKPGEAGRARKSRLDMLLQVRAFYLDIAEWALQDPATWAPWAAPEPVTFSV
ncbi:MAG TPA: hypothetical protein VHH34_05795 [Pseudonocardiaceae bacterium]|nr:hypothetical protein [Pseudonocardiaceae bacterium]